MYCASCGNETPVRDITCSRCRHYSMTVWLALFNGVAWLAILATSFALFANLIPVMGSIGARLDNEISPLLRLQLSLTSILGQFGLLILVIISPVLVILIRRQSKSRRLVRLGRRMAVAGSATLAFMVLVLAANSHSLFSLWRSVDNWMEQTSNENAELKAMDSTRRVVIAEYRYRETHPNIGFTCDLSSLESLGGPVKGAQHNWRASEPNTMSINFYTLSLGGCQGQPAAKYQVTTTPDLVISAGKAVAYCSDGSGGLYFAADGKSATCLGARKPVH